MLRVRNFTFPAIVLVFVAASAFAQAIEPRPDAAPATKQAPLPQPAAVPLSCASHELVSAEHSEPLVEVPLVDVNRSPVSSTFGYYVGGQSGTTYSAAFSVFF
jgi:hypothetical protein